MWNTRAAGKSPSFSQGGVIGGGTGTAGTGPELLRILPMTFEGLLQSIAGELPKLVDRRQRLRNIIMKRGVERFDAEDDVEACVGSWRMSDCAPPSKWR